MKIPYHVDEQSEREWAFENKKFPTFGTRNACSSLYLAFIINLLLHVVEQWMKNSAKRTHADLLSFFFCDYHLRLNIAVALRVQP